MDYALVNDVLARLEDPEERKRFLLLDAHPDFPGQWLVQSFGGGWYFDFREILGNRTVSPASLNAFLGQARELDYEVAFFEDPQAVLAAYDHLDDLPGFSLNSTLPGTINGMLPFQLQGFNFLKDLRGGVVQWSTGVGKTVVAAALLKHHQIEQTFDLGLFWVKAHNRTNTQRALARLADLDSLVVDGPKKKRMAIYEQALQTPGQILVLNYEKARDDFVDIDKNGKTRITINTLGQEVFLRRILAIYDEMPTKLKNRSSQLYKSTTTCLYTSAPSVSVNSTRSPDMRQYMLSATPIENSPEDFFNTVRLLDPTIYGTVKEFENEFVRTFSYFDPTTPDTWKNLPRMGMKAAHITHQVDKTDADIAKLFPKVVGADEPYIIDWNPKHRKIYDHVADGLVEALDEMSVLQAIQILQMLCDCPSMVNGSAVRREIYEAARETWEEAGGPESGLQAPLASGSGAALALVEAMGELSDAGHPKLETLKELLTEEHADEKCVVYSVFAGGLLPILGKYLTEWGVSYVRYDGTSAQKQAAEDAFKSDPSIQVFLSSDKGSDSINLEVASVCVSYDLPWKWSTKIQRENRIHRVTSEFGSVRCYSLLMADSAEERKLEVVMRKQAHHEGVFRGAIAEQAISSRMSAGDLAYILRG